MWKPKYFHEMMTNRVIITNVVSPSQSWTRPPRPTHCRPESTRRPGLQEQREDDAGDGLREDVRQEEDDPEDRAAGEPPIQQDREDEGERDLDRQGEHDDQSVVATAAVVKVVAVERRLVVLQPDEICERLQPVPLVEAVVRSLDDWQQDEHQVESKGWQQEQADRHPLGRSFRSDPSPRARSAHCRSLTTPGNRAGRLGPARSQSCP